MSRTISFRDFILRTMGVITLMTWSSPAAWAVGDHPFTMFLAGAYPFSIGPTHHWMNGEYGILGGFGYQEENWPVGLQFEGMTYRFGFNDNATSFASSDGFMQMTAGTANITWLPEFFEEESVKPRLISGVGVYNRVIRTTEQRLTGGTCGDPWWGYYPCYGSSNIVTNSNSQTKMGFNVGGSVGYEMAGKQEIFVEVRYHHAFTSHNATQFLPVNVGFRW